MKGVSSFASVGICILLSMIGLSKPMPCNQDCAFELIKNEVVGLLAKNRPGMVEVSQIQGTKYVFGIPITYSMQNGILADLRGFQRNSNVMVRRGARMSQIELQMTVDNTEIHFTHARGTVFGMSIDVNNPRATIGAITMSLMISLEEGVGPCRPRFTSVETQTENVKVITNPPLPGFVVDQVHSLIDEVLAETLADVLNANPNLSCDSFNSILSIMSY